ncbi:MATE family efflux transporter [Coprococcus eutactus]|uniref:MATE family efflux transporter n=1 Tax=Coprococcus eutactus TaxID=33043 RepID=UPI0011CC61A5|nr:hypothetical protein [Coprococcus eutactus]
MFCIISFIVSYVISIYNRNNYYYGAVGSVGMISFLFFSLCTGLSSGIGVIVSNCFGAKKKKK